MDDFSPTLQQHAWCPAQNFHATETRSKFTLLFQFGESRYLRDHLDAVDCDVALKVMDGASEWGWCNPLRGAHDRRENG